MLANVYSPCDSNGKQVLWTRRGGLLHNSRDANWCVCVCVGILMPFNLQMKDVMQWSVTYKIIFLLSISSYMTVSYSISPFVVVVLPSIVGDGFYMSWLDRFFFLRSGVLYGMIVYIKLCSVAFPIIARFYCLLMLKIEALAVFVYWSVRRVFLVTIN